MTPHQHHLHHRNRRVRRIIRWSFVIVTVLAACYLVVVSWWIIVNARTALGFTRTNVPGIENLLAVGGVADIQGDSILTPAQIHLGLRVAMLADSLAKGNVKSQQRLQGFATLLNQHATSRATYVWTKASLSRAITMPLTHRDSINARMLHIMQPQVEVLQRVYKQHLDTLITAPDRLR